jgi:TatD DNase family protein
MKVITSGYDIASSQQAIALAEKYENIFASIGIYPEFAENCDKNVLQTLKNLAKNKKVVAIGEIGLQYTDNMPDKEIQKNTFIKQLELANELQLPVVIHCRDAYGDIIELLKENKNLLSFNPFQFEEGFLIIFSIY